MKSSRDDAAEGPSRLDALAAANPASPGKGKNQFGRCNPLIGVDIISLLPRMLLPLLLLLSS